MMGSAGGNEKIKVLITVKTYPIPSARYDELVCTAGVTETGDFIRLYPVNFRDLPFSQQRPSHYLERQVANAGVGRLGCRRLLSI